MRAKKYKSLDNIVVRTEGCLKKDYTGLQKGYFIILKHVGFNCRDKSVYLIQDIFGDTFTAFANAIIHPYFGTRFYTDDSKRKNIHLGSCYHNMIRRCYDQTCPRYNYYGGKGIKVCEEWLGEEGRFNFVKWAALNGYSLGLTIDRHDADKDYMPSNCTWLSKKDNFSKTSRTILTKEKATTIREQFLHVPRNVKKQFFMVIAEQMGCSVETVKDLCYNNRRWN